MVGYLSFLRLGPKLLKFLPGKPILSVFLGVSLVFWIFLGFLTCCVCRDNIIRSCV